MPTRCNRGFYCRSYCLLNMFRAPLCPSSGLCVRCAGCCSILQNRTWVGFRSVLYGTHLQLHSQSLLIYYGTGIASQVQRLSTGRTVRVSNPGGGQRYSLLNIRPNSHWVSPSLLYYGYPASFLGVQRPGRVSTTHPLLVTGLKTGTALYRVSQKECEILRESAPYVKLYRYNPKHLYPKLNGYGDNGQRSLKL